MLKVILYLRAGCSLCDQVRSDLHGLQADFPHILTVIDIESESTLNDSLGMEIPVVEVGPFRLKAPITSEELRMTLGAAADRLRQLETINSKDFQARVDKGNTISKADRIAYWLSKHYLLLMNVFLFFYFGLPYAAPVFKKIGLDLPAEVIYKVYSPLCHQWSFRSWFLFGEQAYYPREAAQINGVISFEQATGYTDENDPARLLARSFEGNEWMGYKVALCQRDEAIWGSMLIFGILFAISGRRIGKLHWLVWLVIGVAPIGLDGFSQLFSQVPVEVLRNLLPYRESTPFLRTLTGFLFGFSTAWFIFPLMEETMKESGLFLAKKFAVQRS